MIDRISILLSTFFYLGKSPFAPGTVGTFGAIALYYLLIQPGSLIFYSFFTFLFIIISFYVSNRSIEILGEDDPGEIVIDEVCGFLVSMFMIPFGLTNIILGFFLFRFFDILKPYPVRKFERLPKGYGVVMDDVAAGVYTNIILHIINYFWL
ncbi:MAG: phosphatidylglycerophosphatase A family protein [Thermodesulfobacteriota bacterium]